MTIQKTDASCRQAISYIRVSTDEQAEHGTSLSSQTEVNGHLAGVNNCKIVSSCDDSGVSGTRYESRPGIMEALRMIESGRASVLIAAKLDRIGRKASVILDIVDRVISAGGEVITGDYKFDNSATGRFLRTIYAGMAEMERDAIIERTKGGRRKRAEAGCQPSRTLSPYGYHIVNHNDVLSSLYGREQTGIYMIVEEQAQWVREMFRRYTGGCSLQDLCKWLNDSGVPTPRGGRYWASPTIRLILMNEAYKGTPAFGKWQRITDEARVAKGFKHTFTQRLKPAEEWVILSCEPLVEPRVWDYCQVRLSEGRARYSGRPSRKYLLSSILRCPVCGGGMNGSYDKKKNYLRYRCRQAMKSRGCGKPQCVDRSYNGATVERFVLNGLHDVVRRPELLDNAMQALAAEGENISQNWADTVTRLQAEIARLSAKERATAEAQVEALQAGGDTGVYLTMLREYRAEKGRLTVEMQEAEAMQLNKVDHSAAATIAEVLAAVDEALSAPEISDGERHDLLARVVQEVVPMEDGCRISLTRFPGTETVNNVLTLWESRQDFLGWVRSEAFQKGHAQSGTLPREAYPQPNVLEMHEVIQDSTRPGMEPEPHGGPFRMH